MCGTFPPARISDLSRSRDRIPALLATPFSPPRRSLKKPTIVAGKPEDLVPKADEGLFAFISTLRLSVRAKVAAEQERGVSLAEIVIQVREMVRIAQHGAPQGNHLPPSAFRAISRQAVAWCVESYRPPLLTVGHDVFGSTQLGDPLDLHCALDRAAAPGERHPALSPNNRELP